MIDTVPRKEMPSWLKTDSFSFDAETVLRDSLYYPASGTDVQPVKWFMGNVYSFVYIDYGVSRGALHSELFSRGFRGYCQIHREPVTQQQLTPRGWSVKIEPDLDYEEKRPDFFRKDMAHPFCEWYIFERKNNFDDSHNPERFSLLFLCADGVASYQSLYLSNGLVPLILAIIQPGHGFGGNWTNFTDRKAILAKSVFHSNILPQYVVNGGMGDFDRHYSRPMWPEYGTLLERKELLDGWAGIWARSKGTA